MKFNELGIDEILLKGIPFETPTEIQGKSIPLILEGKDVMAGSATGSGKTLAFACGIIQKCQKIGKVQAIILVPTRELAQQVSDEFARFAKYKPIRIISVYGGVSINPQIDALKTADIVVGTPGRVLDLMDRRALDLRHIRFAVLDEADRMLDMGFIDDVRLILRECPKERQTLLFSATLSRDITDLAHRYMNHPVNVSVESYVDPKKLTQIYYDIYEDKAKLSLLVHLMKNETSGLVMVFCNTQNTTDFVARNLQKQGIDAVAIHGGLSQAKRNQVMEKFHSNKFTVLVCTDVAARGLDIRDVSHVYNFDIPRDPKAYVHRIGRTARAGKEGKAISLLSSRDHENFSALRRTVDVTIERNDVPEFEKLKIDSGRYRDDDRGRGFGGRGRGGFSRSGGQGGQRRHDGHRDHGRGSRNDQRDSHRGERRGSGDGHRGGSQRSHGSGQGRDHSGNKPRIHKN